MEKRVELKELGSIPKTWRRSDFEIQKRVSGSDCKHFEMNYLAMRASGHDSVVLHVSRGVGLTPKDEQSSGSVELLPCWTNKS